MANIRPLSPELAEFARKELNEDPNRIEADLQHIREWLSKQPHLKARTDDQFLITFLRGCKFSLERTKEKLDAYYTLRTALPEFYESRDPMSPEIQEILKLGLFMPLGVDAQGRRLGIGRMGNYDPSKIKITDVFKVNMMIMEVMMMEDDDVVIKGNVGLMDMGGMTVAHAVQMSPSLAKKFTTLFQDGYPIRPKAMHYLHMPSVLDAVFSLVKSLMKEKLRRRIHVHSSLDSVLESIPKDVLPKEYGGTAGTMQELADIWKKKVEAKRDYFLEDSKYRAEESKRPGKPKTHEDLFGLEGSFRPLSVD